MTNTSKKSVNDSGNCRISSSNNNNQALQKR